MSFDLNRKLKGCEVLKELPPEIVKLYEEIETLRDKLGEFLVVMKPLTRLLRCKETPKTNLAMVSKAKRLYMVKKSLFVTFMEKWVMKLTSVKTSLKRATHQGVSSSTYQHLHANKKKGPKKIWVPMNKIIPIVHLFYSKKETPIMVLD